MKDFWEKLSDNLKRENTDYFILAILTLLAAIPTVFFLNYKTPELETVFIPSRSHTAAVSDFDSNLLGYWKFDEGDGITANDSSGNGNTGTLVNNPLWVGTSLSFSGGPYVSIPSTPFNFGTSSFSVSLWTIPQTNGDAGVVSKITPSVSNGWYINALGTTFRFYVRSDATHYTSANTSVKTGEMVHIVGIVDRANEKIYIYKDGQLANTSSIHGFGSFDTDIKLLIGNMRGDNIFGYNGNIEAGQRAPQGS